MTEHDALRYGYENGVGHPYALNLRGRPQKWNPSKPYKNATTPKA